MYKICIGILKKRCKYRCKGDVKMDLEEIGCETNSSGSGQGQVAGCYGSSYEHSYSIKD